MLLIIILDPILFQLSITATEVYHKALLLLLVCFTCMALSLYSLLFFFSYDITVSPCQMPACLFILLPSYKYNAECFG